MNSRTDRKCQDPIRVPSKDICAKCRTKCDIRIAKYRKKRMGPSKLEKLQSLLEQFEAQKQKCSDDRDKLRGLIEKITEIVDSWEDASETFGNAVDEMQRGIDRMSEYI